LERGVLVQVDFTGSSYRDSWPLEESVAELHELAYSGRVQVLDGMIVRRDRPTAAMLIGKGKVEELHRRCHQTRAEVVVFGQDLSFPQQRNLEDQLGVKIIDRTQLILDIFARRAQSREGKVQVELAQLQYLLPRLAGQGIRLSRLGGGIGTRGPGEQKLEVDRRRIRLRIVRLNRELEQIRQRRSVARRRRQEESVPTAALIGYTNAGKSTLLNALTQANAPSGDRLFTTLDPVSRRTVLKNHQPVVLSDTVGFIHKLPHRLIEAFKATLEEVTTSHLLLHVVDLSHPLLEEKLSAVDEVLTYLGAADKPTLLVFNKKDQAEAATVSSLRRRFADAVAVSALTGEGIPELLDRMAGFLSHFMREATIWISGQNHAWMDKVYSQGKVLHRHVKEEGIELVARIPDRLYGQLTKAGLIKNEDSDS